MKKNVLSVVALLAIGTMCSCGTGQQMQNSSTASSLQSSALQSGITSVLSTLLNAKTQSADVVGTWKYQGPKIVFESENVLSQLSSTLASNKLESMLEKQLKGLGLDAKNTSLVLNKDMTYEFVLGSKTYKGTYTYDANTKQLTLQGQLNVARFSCLATLSGNQLHMLFDADKLLSVASVVAGSSNNLSTLSTLLKSYNGMKMGWTMVRQ